jgi:hypothetical protein
MARIAKPNQLLTPPVAPPGVPGPVVLGTLSVRIDPNAERMALETALEVGVKLIVANMLTMPLYPLTITLARGYTTLTHEEDLDAVRATARRALSLGIRTELQRVSTPRPVRALLELARDCQAGLLVFGPERSRIRQRRYRSAVRVLCRDAPCLVWVAAEG